MRSPRFRSVLLPFSVCLQTAHLHCELLAVKEILSVQEDFYSKTMSGGIITIVCSAMMVILFLSELGVHLKMFPGGFG